ncbi:hypothetical protein M9434_001698 [Picochlorum sp. BPE23]|nr:hypothetical protein M9434_001698 [Picochlorum sp. BPE23]
MAETPPLPSPCSTSESSAYWAGVLTLSLGILGSSCLPVGFAFSNLGLFWGVSFAFFVALANNYTGNIVLVASYVLGKGPPYTYEGMCAMVGPGKGSSMKLIAQTAMFLLLFGTLTGDAALLADCGSMSMQFVADYVPEVFVKDSRWPMILLILAFVFPLSLKRQMRSLERAAAAGILLVISLVCIVAYNCVSSGFPALMDGDFPLFSIPVEYRSQIPQSIAILSFAFYLHPVLLPLLSEMPQNPTGLVVTCSALRIVTLGVGMFTYTSLGLFSGMRYGHKVQGDIIMNDWLPDAYAPFLDVAVAIYLSVSMAPIVLAMRYLVYSISQGDEDSTSMLDVSTRRHVITTVCCIGVPTMVAGTYPKESAMFFSITGATAVCIIGYILPIYVHLRLYFFGSVRREVSNHEAQIWLLEDAAQLEEQEDDDHEESHGAIQRNTSSVYIQEDSIRNHLTTRKQQQGKMDHLNRYPHVSHLAERPNVFAKVMDIVTFVCVPLTVLLLGVGCSILALVLEL